MQEFSPYQTYQNTLRRWWLAVLCVTLGGVLGLILHTFRPALYEAQSLLIASMNFPPNEYYSQFEEDYAFNVAATHISPLAISANLLPALQSQGFDITYEDFIRQASVERKQSAWALRFQSPDSNLAPAVVELWVEQAYEKLAGFSDHSIQAQSYYSQLSFLNACYRYALISNTGILNLPPDYQGVCNYSSLERIHAEQVSIARLFAGELRLSRGINPYFVVDIPDTGGIQVYRTAYDRNLMVLAGALVGLVIGIWLTNLGIFDKGRRG